MQIKIENLECGTYNLGKFSSLYFTMPGDNQLILDKKSAVAITKTLFDSLNLVSRESDKLIKELEEAVYE